MSTLAALLEAAHREENRVGYLLTGMVCSKKANRRVMAQVAEGFRRAADLIDQALSTLPQSTQEPSA